MQNKACPMDVSECTEQLPDIIADVNDNLKLKTKIFKLYYNTATIKTIHTNTFITTNLCLQTGAGPVMPSTKKLATGPRS